MAITKIVSGKIIEEGAATIPFSVLNGIISNLDSEKISLDSKGNSLILKTDNYEATIQSLNEEEFPIIPEIGNAKNHLKINTEVFNDAISKVINCAQISEIRPEISGILFDYQISSLKLAATDSFRLAEKTLFDKDFKADFITGFKAIIPLKTIQEVPRVFREGEMNIYFDSNQVLFKSEDLEIISRLIDGNFPDYDPIVSKTLETESIINKESFINAVRLVE